MHSEYCAKHGKYRMSHPGIMCPVCVDEKAKLDAHAQGFQSGGPGGLAQDGGCCTCPCDLSGRIYSFSSTCSVHGVRGGQLLRGHNLTQDERKKMFAELKILIQQYRKAAIDEAEKGGGDPSYIETLELRLELAVLKLSNHIEKMEREL